MPDCSTSRGSIFQQTSSFQVGVPHVMCDCQHPSCAVLLPLRFIKELRQTFPVAEKGEDPFDYVIVYHKGKDPFDYVIVYRKHKDPFDYEIIYHKGKDPFDYVIVFLRCDTDKIRELVHIQHGSFVYLRHHHDRQSHSQMDLCLYDRRSHMKSHKLWKPFKSAPTKVGYVVVQKDITTKFIAIMQVCNLQLQECSDK
jgi:hypothetical protein